MYIDRALLSGALLLSMLVALVPQAKATDWVAALQQAKWDWNDADATVGSHMKRHFGIYGIRVSGDLDRGTDLFLDFTHYKKSVLRLKAQPKSAFVAVEDTLFWAEYSPIASGGELQSFSLESGQKLWSSKLKGLGPIDHSKYSNAVKLEARDETVWVWGHEASGDYLEVVDQATGKTLANRVFQK